MKLSKKCEYSLLILIELARRCDGGGLVSAAQLSKQYDMPLKFLEQIMPQLKKAGYVSSARGAAGGHRLAKPAVEINLAEVIRLVDGPIAPIASVSTYFYKHTPSEKNEKLLSCFREIRDYTSARLEALTLDQFV